MNIINIINIIRCCNYFFFNELNKNYIEINTKYDYDYEYFIVKNEIEYNYVKIIKPISIDDR
jgi:hypothetical protein